MVKSKTRIVIRIAQVAKHSLTVVFLIFKVIDEFKRLLPG